MSQKQRVETAEPSVVTPSILDPRVERGAALLDEKLPNWHDRINLEQFSLSATDRCVLGQIGLCVYGADYYKTVPRLLDLTGVTAEEREWGGSAPEREHGFWANGDEARERYDDWALLEQDWRLAILSRRTANV